MANAAMSDFDKVQKGKAVSLITKSDVVASDYMTVEEEERGRRRKKEAKFQKKKKDKDKNRKRKTVADDEEVENEDEEDAVRPVVVNSLLAQLEQSAPTDESLGLLKRRRSDEIQEENSEVVMNAIGSMSNGQPLSKRAKYDEIMDKGNQRTKLAFSEDKKPVVVKQETPSVMDDEADDSFLNAALAKARRLNKLKAMNNSSLIKGADAVVAAVKATNVEENESNQAIGTMSFAVDDTREFSRALRARTEQTMRVSQKQSQTLSSKNIVSIPIKKEAATSSQDARVKVEDVVEDEDMNMEELAKEVIHDDIEPAGLEGTTATAAGVGRGLSTFVNMLKTTGHY